jgi:hypothetical protein
MASTNEYSIGGSGNVFSDRLYSEFPYLKGEEISEEEAHRFEAEVLGGGYSVGVAGDVETDRLYNEWGALRGYEVDEQ